MNARSKFASTRALGGSGPARFFSRHAAVGRSSHAFGLFVRLGLARPLAITGSADPNRYRSPGAAHGVFADEAEAVPCVRPPSRHSQKLVVEA
jgi:hypothetical protein